MIPKNIARHNVTAAMRIIDEEGVPIGRESRAYNVVFEERKYPPKYLISLASREANGKLLRSEEFGGGHETNEFLRELGFDVREAKNDPANPQRIRVARAWLSLGLSRNDFRSSKLSNPWEQHKRIVIGQFEADQSAYLNRLSALARAAMESDADVLVFPACAIVHRGDLDLIGTLGSVPRMVMSGVLELKERGPEETAILAHAGNITERFDEKRVVWSGGEGFSIMAAISSTIRQIHKGEPPVLSNAMPPQHRR